MLSWGDLLEIADGNHANEIAIHTFSTSWRGTGTAFGTGFHHIAVTVGGGTITVYRDGASIYTTSGTVSLSGQVSLGTRWNTSESWVGAIDQVRIYNRVLTAAEIQQLAAE